MSTNKNLILFGNTEFTKLMKWYIENDTDRTISAITVEERFIKSTTFEGLPLLPFSTIEKIYSPKEYEILIAVGYSKMNDIREKIFLLCKEKGFRIANYIHSTAHISGNVQIGEGNIVLEDTLIQPYATIGNGNLIWYKAAIAHDCVIGNFNTISGMASICGMVNIRNNCFIGSNATIRDHITVEDYTLVGAGVYVNSDTLLKYRLYLPAKCNVIQVDKGKQYTLI